MTRPVTFRQGDGHRIDLTIGRRLYILSCHCGWEARRKLTRAKFANDDWLWDTIKTNAHKEIAMSNQATGNSAHQPREGFMAPTWPLFGRRRSDD